MASKHKLTIYHNEQYKFKKITCSEGDLITNYDAEGMRPMDYYGTTEIYVPEVMTDDDIQAQYYCITEEKHKEMLAAAEEDRKKWEQEEFEAKTEKSIE